MHSSLWRFHDWPAFDRDLLTPPPCSASCVQWQPAFRKPAAALRRWGLTLAASPALLTLACTPPKQVYAVEVSPVGGDTTRFRRQLLAAAGGGPAYFPMRSLQLSCIGLADGVDSLLKVRQPQGQEEAASSLT